jgi:RecB family exonuclease
MAGLVAELRRTLADPESSEALRDAAARRLARLAGETAGSRPLVPAADPATWWGTRAASRSEQPVRDPEQPVPISASVLEKVAVCPTQWFLEREAGGISRAHQSANLGEMVHALAQRVATGEVAAGPDDVDVLMEHVDQVWDRLEFRTPWSRAREHERVRAALERFLRWHHANPRTLLGTEARFTTVVALPDPSGSGEPAEQVRLTGYADRLELDAEGTVVVVDLKTGRTAPSNKSVESHVQLGLYQLAVDHGAVDEVTGEPARAGGAELVQLGLTDGGPSAAVQPQRPQDDDGPHRAALREQLARTADLLRTETFPAVAGQHCRDCSFVSLCPIKSAGPVTSQ